MRKSDKLDNKTTSTRIYCNEKNAERRFSNNIHFPKSVKKVKKNNKYRRIGILKTAISQQNLKIRGFNYNEQMLIKNKKEVKNKVIEQKNSIIDEVNRRNRSRFCERKKDKEEYDKNKKFKFLRKNNFMRDWTKELKARKIFHQMAYNYD